MKVIVATCDEYRWIIPVFMYFYRKYWPDNPYRTNIVTEKEHIDGRVFYTGGVAWSDGILNYLERNKEDKFLLILEDLLIRSPMDDRMVRKAEQICEGDIGTVRLNNAPYKYFIQHAHRNTIKGFMDYPLSGRFVMGLQPAIFQKRYLLDALSRNEDAWQIEQRGAKRLRELGGKWRSLWPINNIVDVQPVGLMKKGKFKPTVLRWAKAELKADATTESLALYEVLQDQIQRQNEQ